MLYVRALDLFAVPRLNLVANRLCLQSCVQPYNQVSRVALEFRRHVRPNIYVRAAA